MLIMRKHPLRSDIPRLIKPLRTKKELPFEKYSHFVIAPDISVPQGTSIQARAAKPGTPPSQSQSKSQTNPFGKSGFPANPPPPEAPMIDREVDSFIMDAANTSIDAAVEKFFTTRYNATSVAYWQTIPMLGKLYCARLGIFAPLTTSLPGGCFASGSLIRTNSPLGDPTYCPSVDGPVVPQDSPVLVFPLFDYRNRLYAVVEIVKGPGAADFTQTDESFVRYFGYKFGLFSRFLLCPGVQEPLLLDVLQLQATGTLVPNICEKIANAFDARCCDIWKLDKTANAIVRFSVENGDGEQMKSAGVLSGFFRNAKA
jgi:hypothetical protein